MKKRMLSLALCLVLVVGLFSGLTVNASASRLDDLKKEIAEKLIKEKIEQLKEDTQLIVISHQRRTMEQADVLYGVSMQADGVSHVVSQRLDKTSGKVVDA